MAMIPRTSDATAMPVRGFSPYIRA
jgi:hypothetical protein